MGKGNDSSKISYTNSSLSHTSILSLTALILSHTPTPMSSNLLDSPSPARKRCHVTRPPVLAEMSGNLGKYIEYDVKLLREGQFNLLASY